jgi:hypothetical protein
MTATCMGTHTDGAQPVSARRMARPGGRGAAPGPGGRRAVSVGDPRHGLRGLHPSRRCDVDLSRRTVRVHRKLAALRNRMEFGPPKTETGVRTVVLPTVAVSALRTHLATYVCSHPKALLFTGRNARFCVPATSSAPSDGRTPRVPPASATASTSTTSATPATPWPPLGARAPRSSCTDSASRACERRSCTSTRRASRIGR